MFLHNYITLYNLLPEDVELIDLVVTPVLLYPIREYVITSSNKVRLTLVCLLNK